MEQYLKQLESQVAHDSLYSELSEERKKSLPPALQLIHNYKVFGGGRLAVPAELLIPGDEEEFEQPFSFEDDAEWMNMFEEEYREDIPAEFIPFGHFLGSEIVLLNSGKNSVHIFHVSDIVDPEWMQYKLTKENIDLEAFIRSLRPQTISCFLKTGADYECIEIRNNTELKTIEEDISHADETAVRKAYMDLAKGLLADGYELHYVPKWVQDELNK
ncbi:MAG: hypothetical protein K0S33_2944 [Bacteroidetes bacterium]|jgi:hypothetical protein|nr:hypothetical protein [Bacteroidota bacterium]